MNPSRTSRRDVLSALTVAAMPAGTTAAEPPPLPARAVVLTFDDAVKSHRTFVGPLLKELGLRATFFVTQRWMEDRENFMSWTDIGDLHRLGFEIGNHSWTHAGFNTAASARALAKELVQVETELMQVGVPKPVSFAWCGNAFGPESVQVLRDQGYRLARRGMQPEIPYGKIQVGPAFDPKKHHPLLIPTTGDAYPEWTLDHFKSVLAQSSPGKVVVVQFHGVPDKAHPWVHTPPERFQEYARHLKVEGYQTLALRDLARHLDLADPPADPTLHVRYPIPK